MTLHGFGQSSAGLRGVLQSLADQGPQTVPQLARARPVSRQHIQTLVNELVSLGLVELVDNPAHKRSKLVKLTAEGKWAQRKMRRREERVLARLPLSVSQQDIRTALAVLREFRRVLGSTTSGDTMRESRRSAGKPQGGTSR